MNVLLVYPRIPKNTYWSFSYSLPFIGKKSSMPPLGLITVAAMLPKHYNLKLIDMNIEELKDKDIKWADAMFTSSMMIQKDSLKEIIARANKLNVPVVAGGPYPTQYYDQIKGVDHFVLGEAESGVLEAFIKDFEKGIAKKAYARASIRKNKSGNEIDQREYENLINFFGDNADIRLAERPEMSLSPIPRFDLLDIKEYSSMAVQMSRGCPYNCEFCNEGALFGNNPRLKSSDKFVEELQTIYDLKYRGSVFVVDDNFIGNIKKAKDVLKKTIEFQKEKKYPFGFFTEASINLAWDDELMGLMRDAGFNMVFVGFESVDKEVLTSMNKFQNLKMDPVESVRRIQKHGMEVTGGFIVGNDNDPKDIYNKIFDFCQETGLVKAMVGLLTAFKGSELYERLGREGRLLDKHIDGDNTHSFELDFMPLPGKDKDEISSNYKHLLERLYDRNGKNYFERCKVLLNNLGPSPKPSRDIGWPEIRALRKSLLEQSLFNKYSKNYRRFLLSSLAKHRKLFTVAFIHAITGKHFIKITNTALKADSLQEHLSKKYEYFKTQMEEAIKTRKAESVAWYENKIKEKDTFLRKARKKINRLPIDYRPRLLRDYKHIAVSLNSLI